MADIRDARPEGVSPHEEWHGPYEVVRHPDTGRYYVIDNAGRQANTLPIRGYAELEGAVRQRDYIDTRRASKEKSKALAERIFNSGMAILDPLGTPESRHSEQVIDATNRLMATYGDPTLIEHDEDGDPYVRVDATDGSGWFVVDHGYGNLRVRHVADPTQDQDRIDVSVEPESFGGPRGSKVDGWNLTHTQAEINAWSAEVGEDYARNVVAIVRWNKRRR